MTREEELNEAWCKYMNKCSTEIMQALAFALRWCEEHPHWISVVDELPKKEGWILICSYSDVDMWYYNGQTAKDLVDYASITHWMPLPKMPVLSNSGNTGKDLKGE